MGKKYKQRDARIQLVNDNGEHGEILYGKWGLAPWGKNDDCFEVTLDSGQRLCVWLGDKTPSERRRRRRLVLKSVEVVS